MPRSQAGIPNAAAPTTAAPAKQPGAASVVKKPPIERLSLETSDGVRLAVSLYFPGRIEPKAPAPVLLIQTRYGRAGARMRSPHNRSINAPALSWPPSI